MENVSLPSGVTDPVLVGINERINQIILDLISLYALIKYAKENGYSYNELEITTGMPRGTIQNIAAGQAPKFEVRKYVVDNPDTEPVR